MTMYVTPEKYRTMGFGIDLDGVEDFELASILNRASAIAEGYCTVPRLPKPHSFLGGVITTDHPEQHRWRLPENSFDIGSRRVYPYHWPIKSIEMFKVKATNSQYVTIAPSELFINNTERYIEVISLAFLGVGLYGAIIPSIGLMRPVAEIAYTYGYDLTATDERIYATDARTYRAQNQYWDATTVAVRKSGTLVPSGYTVDRTEGAIVFDSSIPATDYIDVDYGYRLPSELRDAIGLIAVHLLGEREQQARGMTGVKRLKVAEVEIENMDEGGPGKLTAENIAYIEPEAAWLLDGFKFLTARI